MRRTGTGSSCAAQDGTGSMRTVRVTVLPYDRAWADAFEDIRREIEQAAGAWLVGVEHVGSTSVEGMSAKPCIDLDAVIPSYEVFGEVAARLAMIGYEHEGDLGIPGREAFRYQDKPHLMTHHLYVCPQDSAELRRHVMFRDYLRSHPEAAARYSRIKEEAARLTKKMNKAAAELNFEEAAVLRDELKKYKELLDNGIITQEEFDAKKKQLLGL